VKLESSNRDPQILGTSKQFELRIVQTLCEFRFKGREKCAHFPEQVRLLYFG